jgi:hypothetical protein
MKDAMATSLPKCVPFRHKDFYSSASKPTIAISLPWRRKFTRSAITRRAVLIAASSVHPRRVLTL